MAPNTQEQEIQGSFTNSFWSRDKSGMNQLLDYMKSTHDDLDIIYTMYTERSKLEQEFGEKLLLLSSVQEIDEGQLEKGGVPAAYHTISMELKKTASSHIELSKQMNDQVIHEFQVKLEEYKVLLEKWTNTLNELYSERQEKTVDLLKIRAKYLKEHEASNGQATSTMDKLKSQYKALVVEVDELSQEWNSIWKDACEVMEAMEEDRIEFLKSNVWEYANLASARLLLEDEWCETIRKQLEKCSAEEEIERCITIYGTGSKIPTTNDYVAEQMREQKKKNAEQRSNAPKPPTKPARHQDSKLKYQQEPPEPRSRSQQKSSRAQVDTPSTQEASSTSPLPPPHPKSRTAQEAPLSSSSTSSAQPKSRNKELSQSRPQILSRHSSQASTISKKDAPKSQQQRKASTEEEEEYEKIINQQQQQHTEDKPVQKEEDLNQIRHKISDNIGSTAARGPIKRKPLNKSLMDQVSTQMAMARQQPPPQKEDEMTPVPLQRTNSNGSLESLLKTFEVVAKPVTPPPNAPVSEEARSRRQPSEYKPDTGSVPTRRGMNSNVVGRGVVAQETSDTLSNIPSNPTHPVAAPKSPRPPAQQIQNDVQKNNHMANGHNNMQSTQSMMNETMYNTHNQQQQHMGQPHYMSQQGMNQPQHQQHQQQQHHMNQQHMNQQHMGQPHMNQQGQPQRSPMMQPQRSPMMQAQRSPMMQPQRSPMMQPQRSPMMAPMHSPMIQSNQLHQQYGTQRGGIPPPISIPTTNYGVTPQPSPGVIYTNGGVSPGGILPPPAVPYQAPPAVARPTHYSDGKPILFWARAKYNYTASDVGEVSFSANTLIGMLEADMTHESWWVGAIWDEYRLSWSVAGSIPSNFMATV
ncbi:hypothetical protein BD770DRAFT_445439 [Pilaira anomala]|nr:hypothetical protein BD770DRAFT_445439 [Pilaira anomala]